jgi:hypothetical protein
MAGVNIETGPVDYRDQLSRTPKEKWASVFSERRLYIGAEFQHGCRCVIDWLAEAEEFHAELGYESADEMLQEELNIPPDWVRMAVAVLEATGENLSKLEVDHAIELKSHGGDRRSDEARQDQDYNISLKQQGTSADYIKARLRRDHPEIAERLEQGEFKSARQAGIAAGFVKNVPAIRLVDDINVIAQKLCQHLNPEQRRALAEALLQ